MKRISELWLLIVMITCLFSGCGNSDDTIQTIIISNTSYSSKSELEAADKPDTLTADNPVYASIHFIESPKGMEYSVKWYLNETEVKSETKATVNDAQDIIVYELEGKYATEGDLKLEVSYKDTVLQTQELKIQ